VDGERRGHGHGPHPGRRAGADPGECDPSGHRRRQPVLEPQAAGSPRSVAVAYAHRAARHHGRRGGRGRVPPAQPIGEWREPQRRRRLAPTVSDQARSPGLPRIAVVGTGRMGTAMVTRLSAAGARPIVYNRTRSKAEALADLDGVSVADTPREAAGAEIVVVSLGDDAALLATYQGGDGLVAGLRNGSVIVDTSTVDPQTVLALSPQVEAAGGRLLDAPVSGSVPLVEKGELTFMVGGDAGTLDRVRPVLEVLGRHVFHVGGQGAGAV